MNNYFHIHTYRCGHTDGSMDEDYIKRVMTLGGKTIWFTDHAPFPDNPFGNRMSYEDLDEYITSLQYLKNKYKDKIDVKIGLEIEYFPSYEDYYKELKAMGVFDCLLLGQHMYEINNNQYSFSLPKDILQAEECYGLANAIKQGLRSGYFDVVAHPDRIFRRVEEWNTQMDELSKEIIDVCIENGIAIEDNLVSKKENKYYNNFWSNVPFTVNTIIGYDAHSLKDIEICDR